LDVGFFVDVDKMWVYLCIFVYIWVTSSGPGSQRHEQFLTRVFIGF